MNDNELITVVTCALVGFWVVSYFYRPKKKSGEPTKQGGSRWRSTNPGKQSADDGDGTSNRVRDWYKRQPHSKSWFPNGEKFDADQVGIGETNDEKALTWYELLEVSESASLDEVREAHDKLLSRYESEKVSILGEEFKSLANKKIKAINHAYDYALRLKR